MDLFEKCLAFDRAEVLRKDGIYPYFKILEASTGPEATLSGRRIVMAGSNNYLGLTSDPRVIKAAKEAIDRYGTSTCGSRFMSGTFDLHVELERRLARFLGYEDALVLATGYQTPQAIIPILVERGEIVLSDKDNHASIARANVMASGLKARVLRYRHRDMAHLEELLRVQPFETPKLIVTDGVFSTTGAFANLPAIVELARRYNARVMCDDAHATGVLGPGGRGSPAYYGLGADQVDIVMGTFSKSFASQGGFVVGPRAVIDFLRNVTPPLMFSASPPPSAAAAALAALEIVQMEPERIARLQKNVAQVIVRLSEAGFRLLSAGGSGIVSFHVGDEPRTFEMAKRLLEDGVFVNPFVLPGVRPGEEMIRTSYMATHEQRHLDTIVGAITRIGRELGLVEAAGTAT